MRITVFLLLFSVVQVMGESSYSQNTRLSLNLKNVPIEQVLDEIENQSEFFFLFNQKLVNVDRKVDINVKNKRIKDILSDLFTGEDVNCLVIDRQILLSPKNITETVNVTRNQQPQDKVVTGKVTDKDGISLPGVNILIKGTVIGTVTDIDGNYRLETDDPSVILVFSYVGYMTQEFSLEGQTEVNITLEVDILGLEEVVVIGYGTQKKATVTGSIATVEGAELQKTPATNLSNTLAGRMTGVVVNTRGSMPGAESININIRGKGSWRGGNPLIIIDGIANRYGFERLNPIDIESISVLKDASAAIYGSRAANGVILVTTKRGKEGKPTIEYTGDFGLTQPTRVPEMCRSWQYATYYTEAGRSGYIWSDEEIEKFKQGTDVNLYPNYDLEDYMLQSVASQTTHTLSVRGGSDMVKYYVSGRYLYQDSYFKDGIDDFNSYNVRSNIDAQVTKNFNLSLDLSGRRDDITRASGSYFLDAIEVGWFTEMLGTDPTKPIYYENGLPASIYSNNLIERIKGEGGEKNNETATINSQIAARWDLPFITKGLYLEGTGAYDFINISSKEFSKSYDLYSYDNSTGEYTNMNVNPIMNRSLNDYYFNSYQYTLNGKLGYEKVFNHHSFNTFVGYEQYSTNTEWINATRDTFLSDQIPFLFAGDANTQKNDGSGSEYAYRNVFGRIAYNYKGKYLLDFTLRRDESLKFPPHTRVGWFPGISVGWRLSDEPFIRDNIEYIDNLKLRVSYGQMGSDNVGAYQYMETAALQSTFGSMVFGSNPPAVTSTLYFTGTPNPNITWEVANSTNIALEGSLWNGLLGFELEYFYSKRSNILATRNASVPIYAGMTLPDENIGKAQNQGFEILLRHRRNIGNFSYEVSGNFTYTANEIIYMDESPNIPDYPARILVS